MTLRAPRASRNGGKRHMSRHHPSGFGGSVRDATWVDGRGHELVRARDTPSPLLQAFNCRHGCSPGASNRGGASPIDEPFICLRVPADTPSRRVRFS